MNKDRIIQRFIEYVKIDTQSNPESNTTPSTEKQWVLAKKLVQELESIGMQEVSIDKNAFVMATLPATVDYQVPTIGFIAHFDTSPDFTAENVNPQIVSDYQGQDIILNKELNIILSPNDFPEMKRYIGQTLITTDGTTLLGADDKAGITEIVSAMEYLIAHPEIPHGRIRVAFTPDEEIGLGALKFDVEKFDAQWAYTLDGSHLGELEYENFNAAGAKITIKGKSVHPGTAKNKMINSMLIAAELIEMLPKNQTPQTTESRQGFFHITNLLGDVENTTIGLIIRDHDAHLFEQRKQFLTRIVEQLNEKYGQLLTLHIKDQYRNMKEKIDPVFHIVEIAKKAMEELDIEPIIQPIRGGTDGSHLSFKGLPCPNIFAGGINFHGKYEYLPVESMLKATEVVVKIAELTAKQYQK